MPRIDEPGPFLFSSSGPATQTITLAGIASDTALGALSTTPSAGPIALAGIPSDAALGPLAALAEGGLALAGIPSDAALGALSAALAALSLTLAGIASDAALGALSLVDALALSDTFTGTGLLTAHTPDVGTGSWSVLSGTPSIGSGLLRITGGSGNGAVYDVGTADVEIVARLSVEGDDVISIDAAANATLSTRVQARLDKLNNQYAVRLDSGAPSRTLTPAVAVGTGQYDVTLFYYRGHAFMRIGSETVHLYETGGATHTGTRIAVDWQSSSDGSVDNITVSRLSRTQVKRIGWIADSISVWDPYNNKLVQRVAEGFNGGRGLAVSRSASGEGYTLGGASGLNAQAQADAMVSDDVDVVILPIGTNDPNTVGLQATAEAVIATLKRDHPQARIYVMEILPVTTGNAVKDANRARLAAAAAAQGVTYWATSTWINPTTDTTDGIHLTTGTGGGAEKVATQVIARLNSDIDQALTLGGVASDAALGTLALTPGAGPIALAGISSDASLGVLSLVPGAGPIALAGIPSDAALGPLSAILQGAISLQGIPATDALGLITVVPGPGSLNLAGVPSDAALGALLASPGAGAILLGGIPSDAALGALAAVALGGINLAGIPSDARLGVLTLVPGAGVVLLVGIASDARLGMLLVTAPGLITPLLVPLGGVVGPSRRGGKVGASRTGGRYP